MKIKNKIKEQSLNFTNFVIAKKSGFGLKIFIGLLIFASLFSGALAFEQLFPQQGGVIPAHSSFELIFGSATALTSSIVLIILVTLFRFILKKFGGTIASIVLYIICGFIVLAIVGTAFSAIGYLQFN